MIPTTYMVVMILAFLSGMTTIIGVALAFAFRRCNKGIATGLGFSAGIMIVISVFELVPESIEIAGLLPSIIALSLGVVLIGSLHFIIPHTHLIKEKCPVKRCFLRTAYLCAFGLILHDFPEGFAMANSFLVSPSLGLIIAAAIALHNIPEEFAMSVPIMLTKDRRFLLKMAFLSGLAEPAGAVIGLSAAFLMPSLTPLFMSFAAGAMIFVSIHELIPMAHKYERKWFFILGLLLSILVYFGLAFFIPE